ncbi:MAG: type II secretion system protein GspE, partial [Oscillospiraceae bacterium]|nr:type II secretion system protein GspE [Oscillospiraceae bacterium]
MSFIKEKKRIGDLLLGESVITEEQLQEALAAQKTNRKKLGATLVELGFTNEQQIAFTLHKQLGLDIVDLSTYRIPKEILNMVPDSTVLKRHGVIPFEFDPYDSKYLRVAMSDPMDIMAIDDLAVLTGMQISPTIATSTEIMATIDKYYGNAETQAVADQYAKERGEEESDVSIGENESVENAPIVILVKKIIEQAVRQRASDIHIEPFETLIRVRYRVDGVMQNNGAYPISMLPA